jgi:hypothetical protein
MTKVVPLDKSAICRLKDNDSLFCSFPYLFIPGLIFVHLSIVRFTRRGPWFIETNERILIMDVRYHCSFHYSSMLVGS